MHRHATLTGRMKSRIAGDSLILATEVLTPTGMISIEGEGNLRTARAAARDMLRSRGKGEEEVELCAARIAGLQARDEVEFALGFLPLGNLVHPEAAKAGVSIFREMHAPDDGTRSDALERVMLLRKAAARGSDMAGDVDYAIRRLSGAEQGKRALDSMGSFLDAIASAVSSVASTAASAVDALRNGSPLTQGLAMLLVGPGALTVIAPKTAAMIAASALGVPPQSVDAIYAVAKQAGIPMPENSAHGLGMLSPDMLASLASAAASSGMVDPSAVDALQKMATMKASAAAHPLVRFDLLKQIAQRGKAIPQAKVDQLAAISAASSTPEQKAILDSQQAQADLDAEAARQAQVGSFLDDLSSTATDMFSGGKDASSAFSSPLASNVAQALQGNAPGIAAGTALLKAASGGDPAALSKISATKAMAQAGVPKAQAALGNLKAAQEVVNVVDQHAVEQAASRPELSTASALTASSQVLKLGSKGPDVGDLQRSLLAAGFDPKGTDGKFGKDTLEAVKAFQSSKGLKADGIVGPDTKALLAGRPLPPRPKETAEQRIARQTAPGGELDLDRSPAARLQHPSRSRWSWKDLIPSLITTNPMWS